MDLSTADLLGLPLPTALNAGGWLAVVTLVVVSMVRGWLLPASQVDRLLADKDRQIADWKEAARLAEARADLSAQNVRALLEGVQTTNELVRALDRARDSAS